MIKEGVKYVMIVMYVFLYLHNCQETGYVTSEKLTPSPITICADIKQAIGVERRSGAAKLPLKDVLGKVIAQYNRMVTIKRHRIESARRALIYNLFLGLIFSFSL